VFPSPNPPDKNGITQFRVCEERSKRAGNDYYLFIARVCPAAGEPDLKTAPPRKTETSRSQRKGEWKMGRVESRLLSATNQEKKEEQCKRSL
jgi:hypothetical protein